MDVIREILLDIIEALLFLVLFEIFYNKKGFVLQNKAKTALFCILYFFANFGTTLYIPKIYHTMFLSIFCILLLTCITQIRIFASIVIFSAFISIIFFTKSFIQFIEILIFKVNLDQIFSNSKYFWIFLIFSKTLQILIGVIILKFNVYFAKFKLFEKEGTLFTSLIIQTGIFSLFIFIVNFSVFDRKNIIIYNILIFIIYFLFLLIEFKDLVVKEKIININKNYKVQKHQIENMKEIIDIIRKEKHDFANHINVIRGLCLLNKPNTIERLNDYVIKISDTLHSSFRYLNIGNDYLDVLLSIKNNYAIKNNINFKVLINEPFTSINIREDELISIISNLIDNAFEAFQLNSSIENKEISIATFKKRENFCIEISNNGEFIPENVKNKIFDKRFSTKASKKDNHGFRLYIAKQLVERNNGTIYFESITERTKFLIEFELGDV